MEEMKTEEPVVSLAPVGEGHTCSKAGCQCEEGCACAKGKWGTCGNHCGAWVVAGAILLGSLIIAASLLSSVGKMSKGATTPTVAPTAQNDQNQPGNKNATVSLAGAPVLGNKEKAKVAIVEFSDYECPFCKQFHQTTLSGLTKEFVDSGKAVYAFRNYPLPFHEPNASKAANLALCVREAKGDSSFFAFSAAYYANTQANGKGLPAGKQDEILRTLGVNAASVTQCAESEKFKDTIAKDTNDGSAVGVNGTPSFVIGKLDSKGNVTGELAVGAMPIAQFETTINKYLAQ